MTDRLDLPVSAATLAGAILVACCLVVLAVGVGAVADTSEAPEASHGDLVASLGEGDAEPGETVTVPFEIDAADEEDYVVQGVDVTVTWDPDVVTFSGAEGDALGSLVEGDPEDGAVTLVGADAGGTETPLRVADLAFEVVGETDDSSSIAFEADDSEIQSDAEATAWEAGSITVGTATPASFEIDDLDPGDATVEPGATVDVSATVTNVGDSTATRTVTLAMDDAEVDEREITLETEESTSVSFDLEVPDDEGTYPYAMSSPDDTASGSLVVEGDDPSPAFLSVDLLEPGDVTVDPDETVAVTAEVENIGGQAGAGTVALTLDGATVDEADVDLSAGDATTVELSLTAPSTGGSVTYGVATDDGQDQATLTVATDSADVRLPDQALGEDGEGDPAIYLHDVAVDAPHELVATAGEDGPVIGAIDAPASSTDPVVVPVEADVFEPGPVAVHVVPDGTDITVGDPLDGDVTPVETDTGVIYEASLRLTDAMATAPVESLVVEDVALRGGDGGYDLAIHELEEGGDLGAVLGTAAAGGDASVTVPLEEPLGPGERSLAAALHLDDGPLTTLAGSAVAAAHDVGTVTVDEAGPGAFVIESVSVPDDLAVGADVTVEVTVANEGDEADTQAVALRVDGQEVDRTNATIAAGDSDTVTLQWTPESPPGERDLAVSSPADETTLAVTLEAAPSDQPGFAIAVALVALVATAAWVDRRRRRGE